MTQRTVAAALGLILGIVLSDTLGPVGPWAVMTLVCIALSAVGLGTTVWLIRRENQWVQSPAWLTLGAVLLFALPLGYWRSCDLETASDQTNLAGFLEDVDEPAVLEFEGSLAAEPELRGHGENDSGTMTVRIERIRREKSPSWTETSDSNILLRVAQGRRSRAEDKARFAELMHPEAYGYRIAGTASYHPPEPVLNPNAFDQQAYLRQNHWIAEMRAYDNELRILERLEGNPVHEFAFYLKKRFLQTYKQTVSQPAIRLLAAATLGLRRGVEVEFKDSGMEIVDIFRHAGVGHVVAVSGLHVTVITLVLFTLFSAGRISPKVFVPLILISLLLFTILTGARPSTVRAAIMNSVGLVFYAYFAGSVTRATFVGLAVSSIFILYLTTDVLYSPSFQLSFGAVLSIVIVGPVVEKWFRRFRGWSLLFLFVWLGTLMAIANRGLEPFLSVANLLAMAAALVLLTMLGARLNHWTPRAWTLGMERIPGAIRGLIAIQLGIQLGMMVPLSAWFFGQFSLSGIVVNIIAIPTVGVIIQLGILTGLAGLIPGVGLILAAPLGAAASIACDFFIWLAYAGVQSFNFPVAPRPSLPWMIGYYIVLAGVLNLRLLRSRYQALAYNLARKPAWQRYRPALSWAIPVLLLLPAAVNSMLPQRDTLRQATVCHVRTYPMVTFESDHGRAAVLNAGTGFTGKFILFDILRGHGVTRVPATLTGSPEAAAGLSGTTALAEKMNVALCYAPVAADSADAYLDGLGDDYLVGAYERDSYYTKRMVDDYGDFVKQAAELGIPVERLPDGKVVEWHGLTLDALPPSTVTPDRFAYKKNCRLVRAELGGHAMLVLSDGMPECVEQVLRDNPVRADIVVLPDDNFPPPRSGHYRAGGTYWTDAMKAVLEQARPNVVILNDGSPQFGLDPVTFVKNTVPDADVFATFEDGAVTLRPQPDGSLRLHAFKSDRTLTLPPLPGQ